VGEARVPADLTDGRRFWKGLLLVLLVCLIPATCEIVSRFVAWPWSTAVDVSSGSGATWRAQLVPNLLEWTACSAALLTAVLLIMHRRLWDNPAMVVLGLSVACCGGLHLLRTLLILEWAATPFQMERLLSESWSLCRLANASILLLTLLLLVLRPQRNLGLDGGLVLLTACGFGTAMLVCMRLVDLEGFSTTGVAFGGWSGRPVELLTVLPYAMALLLLFPRLCGSRDNVFMLSMWLSMVPQIVAQLHLACATDQSFGRNDHFARALALFAQLLPLAGLCRAYGQMLLGKSNRVRELEGSERELRRLESRARQLIETAMDAVVTADADGRILSWNHQAVEVFGLFPAQARGRQLTEFVSAGEQMRLLHRMQQEVSTGSGVFVNQRTEVMAQRADGKTFPVEVSMKSVTSDGETVYCAFVRDITQRLRTESELREAKLQAEAASRAKTEFLANMSHEVRTPMTAVLGCTDLLFEPGLSSTVRREALDTIRRNGRHLLQLLDDILDLSKIEAGKIDIENVMMSPWSTVAEVVSLYRLRAEERGLKLLAAPLGLLPRLIRCDRRRLRQILVNFVSNALKFTDQGQVEVRVCMQDAVAGGPRRIRFDVVDDGVGMNAEMLARIFSPFEQADTSTTRRHGGSGLGLAICNRLAAAMQGEIVVDSRPGHGSCFSLLLPAVDAGALLRIDPLSSSMARSEDSTDGLREINCYRGRALLVEDMPDNRKVLKFYLEAAGLSVDTMENGREGVQQALCQEYDLVLMDMQMPELDGYEAARRLRAAGYRQPIVALTAQAMASDREKCIRAGCSDYITKPIEYQRLLSVIGSYCERSDALDPDPGLTDRAQADSAFQALLHEYVEGLPERVIDLERALSDSDLVKLESLLHQTVGAAGSYGFAQLSECASLLQDAVRERQEQSLLQELIDELADAARAAAAEVLGETPAEQLPRSN